MSEKANKWLAVVNEKSVYDHVICENRIEKEFVQNLDNAPDVRLFF